MKICLGLLAVGSVTAWGQYGPPGYAPSMSASDPAPKASVAPSFSISVSQMGYSEPSIFYLGARIRLVSLDFIGEDKLLFSFRVPGLIHRATKDPEVEERQVRAVVLSLSSGTVEAETVWRLHDRERYLWMLKDGSFLLRDGADLHVGNMSLQLKPRLHFLGPVEWVGLDPSQQFLVTNSDEPLPAFAEKNSAGSGDGVNVYSESGGQGDTSQKDKAQLRKVVRILQRESGKVVLVSRARGAVHLAINSEGYVESYRATQGDEWLIEENYFSGGRKILGSVSSTCRPGYDFLTQTLILASACTSTGTQKMVAVTSEGKHLWDILLPPMAVWPMRVTNASGTRLAVTTLMANHSVTAYSPLSTDDVKGQAASVYDTATGKVVLTMSLNPVLDGGGNIAISPSGKRVAVLNGGAIQVFDLPEPAAFIDKALDTKSK